DVLVGKNSKGETKLPVHRVKVRDVTGDLVRRHVGEKQIEFRFLKLEIVARKKLFGFLKQRLCVINRCFSNLVRRFFPKRMTCQRQPRLRLFVSTRQIQSQERLRRRILDDVESTFSNGDMRQRIRW